jgi:subtilisin family serine protease
VEYSEYPWYFEQLGVENSWSITQGSNVVIDLIDSCVDFDISLLKDKNYQRVFEGCGSKNDQDVFAIHGTAMAGVIGADKGALPKKEDISELLFVAGIAPEVKIKNTIGVMNVNNLNKVLIDAKDESPKSIYGESVLKAPKDRERVDIVLVNLSGGQISANTVLRTDWNDEVSKICKDNSNVLIIAAVGNSATYLTKDNIETKGILPSTLKPKACKNIGTDPIIRVGATNHYNKTNDQPNLYFTHLGTGSSYGKEYVDILAPGQSIPIILPGGYASIAGGTSEATAIVTATAALLASCKPYATSKEIRDAILDNASKYVKLEKKVLDGNVLDIAKTVKQFCIYSQRDIGKKMDSAKAEHTKDEL